MVNHNYEQDNEGNFWAGLLAGLLIGGLAAAVAMLLLAPQSGEKTRAKLTRQSHKLREQTTETVRDAMKQARGKARQITKAGR